MNMSYKGDTYLQQLLKASGETRSLQDIKEVLAGINAAPEDIAAPTLWLKLFKIGAQIRVSVRKVCLSISESYPFADLLDRVLRRLQQIPLRI